MQVSAWTGARVSRACATRVSPEGAARSRWTPALPSAARTTPSAAAASGQCDPTRSRMRARVLAHAVLRHMCANVRMRSRFCVYACSHLSAHSLLRACSLNGVFDLVSHCVKPSNSFWSAACFWLRLAWCPSASLWDAAHGASRSRQRKVSVSNETETQAQMNSPWQEFIDVLVGTKAMGAGTNYHHSHERGRMYSHIFKRKLHVVYSRA